MNTDGHAYVLVTGSRSYTDRATVVRELDRLLLYRSPLSVMHGAHGHGPDLYASEWADALPDTEAVEIRRPVTGLEWRTLGASAGPRRNQAMVKELVTMMKQGNFVRCLAFLGPCISATCRRTGPHDSHGASGCADMAEQAGLWTTRYPLKTEEDT